MKKKKWWRKCHIPPILLLHLPFIEFPPFLSFLFDPIEKVVIFRPENNVSFKIIITRIDPNGSLWFLRFFCWWASSRCRTSLGMLTMEKEFDSKLNLQGNSSSNGETISRSKSFAFKAPQENFTSHDFELGKIYGVGSYSKVSFFDSIHIFPVKIPSFSAIWFHSWINSHDC